MLCLALLPRMAHLAGTPRYSPHDHSLLRTCLKITPSRRVQHTIFGEVAEGLEVLEAIEEAPCDDAGRPLQNIRIRHTIVLEDPTPDPRGLAEHLPEASPEPQVGAQCGVGCGVGCSGWLCVGGCVWVGGGRAEWFWVNQFVGCRETTVADIQCKGISQMCCVAQFVLPRVLPKR